MNPVAELDRPLPPATDGEIAGRNLESACRSAWARFTRNPTDPGVAVALVDMERLNLQLFGDPNALDRLEMLAEHFAGADTAFCEAHIHAVVASTAHRFADARDHLARANTMGHPREDINRQRLAIDQACGVRLDEVLAARRRIATASGRLEDLVPLGALLADLDRFDEADAVYRQAFSSFADISPFPLAWVCFQLGRLWGELVRVPDHDLAALWYRRALSYLPGYVKARVHLAEIYAGQGHTRKAEALLVPALSSGDPEVRWRLADVLAEQGKLEESKRQLDAARSGFDMLIGRHLLAFADHAAEFFAGSGNDRRRALELARANAANRPTPRALRQAQSIATRDYPHDLPLRQTQVRNEASNE